ncbi:MAG TPA: HTTM domain-containing protein [Polyangiaceae bacterium]|nr:HTTM domain-containing protein [Polyangiaceae bacterium]
MSARAPGEGAPAGGDEIAPSARRGGRAAREGAPAGGGGGALGGLGRWLREEGETYVLGLTRLGFGLLLLSASMTLFREARRGFFRDHFHLSFLPEALLPSAPVYRALLGAHLLLALWVVAGWRARPALGLASLVGLYLLLCDRLEYHNNRYALYCYAFLLSFAPCDRAFALGAPRDPSARRGPLWAQRLVQAQASLVYLASSLTKLADPDWRGGVMLGDRAARFLERRRLGWPVDPFLEWFAQPHVASPFSKLVIATELFLALGLWAPRARAVALWVGLFFHVTIEVTQQVQLFSYTTLTVYLLFAAPATRERALEVPPARAKLGERLRLLDWLARFEVRPAAEGAPLAAVDRDGRRATGFGAFVVLCRALPLLFPLWLPLAALERARALARRPA